MRVAVYYSGLPRHITRVFSNHLATLRNSGHDFYFYLYTTIGITQGWTSHVRATPQDLLSQADQDQIVSLINPIAYQFQDLATAQEEQASLVHQIKGHSEWKPEWSNPENYVSQYYASGKATDLVTTSGREHDVVLRLRTDILFDGPMVSPFSVDSFIHSPDTEGLRCFGIDDYLEYGSPAAMRVYGDLYSQLHTLRPHPEIALAQHLERNGIPIARDWDTPYTILR